VTSEVVGGASIDCARETATVEIWERFDGGEKYEEQSDEQGRCVECFGAHHGIRLMLQLLG
jgi:hypothetical protein